MIRTRDVIGTISDIRTHCQSFCQYHLSRGCPGDLCRTQNNLSMNRFMIGINNKEVKKSFMNSWYNQMIIK